MKHIYILLFICVPLISFSQENWEDFSGKQRAFLFDQVRKVNTLKTELLHLFEFADSIPYINDTLPDYSYVEKEIVNSPDLLLLHRDQMKRKSPGIVADLAVRYALWELGQVLQYRNSTDDKNKPLKEKLKIFEKYVLEEAPQSAVKLLNNGDYTLAKTVQGYYSASLTVSDKMAGILNSGYSRIDQMLILNALMMAQEKYVHNRAKEVYFILGGSKLISNDFLSAVGDGANWAEIKGKIATPYSIGLPDEIGLFRFIIEEDIDEEKNKTNLKVRDVVSNQFNTSTDASTFIHADVFGYHPERQTTISVHKGDKAYVLYGKNEHRMVSPDSSYGEGTTYWRLMDRLENYYIANTREDLYGKRGYEYQIDVYEKKIEGTLLDIKKTEIQLDKLRHTPEGKPKMKKKKIKKKDLGSSYQDGQGHPTSAMSKLDKQKLIQQKRLVELNGILSGQKAILAQLIEDMEQAHKNLVIYEARLDYMRKNIGYIIMEYEEENGVYTYSDGAKFIYNTQDFIFPQSDRSETFQVFHIMFGKEVFAEQIDENFAHINFSYKDEEQVYTLRSIKRDNANNTLTPSDSVQLVELFQELSDKKLNCNLTINAGGVLSESGESFSRTDVASLSAFDPENTPNFGLVEIKAKRYIDMEIQLNVYDDPMIPGDFTKHQAAYEKLKQKYNDINEVDFYTGLRAKHEAAKWVEQVSAYAELWIKNEADRKMVLKKLKKLKAKKVSFVNGKYLAKVPDLYN